MPEGSSSKRIWLDTCASTNEIAMTYARANCVHGTNVISDQQTSGKGRMGRIWDSYPGNIAMSVVIRPALSITQGYRLVFVSSNSLAKSLGHFGVEAKIKWPNDILIFQKQLAPIALFGKYRKVAGILIEQITTENRIDAAVIGVGLNLCRPGGASVLENVGFIDDLGMSIERHAFLDVFMEQLLSDLKAAESDFGYSLIHAEVKQRSMLIGEEVVVELGNESVQGKVQDIALNGALVLEKINGETLHVYLGDIYLNGKIRVA